MFPLCNYKITNSFYVPQRIVNRAIQRALGKHPLPRDAEPHFLDLIRDDPINFAPRYDLTRARVAYGRLGLPILMRDLEGTDTNKQHLAASTLTDLFHDSEILYYAVELNIVERIYQLLGSSIVDIEDAALNALSIACTRYVGSKAVITSESKCLDESTIIDQAEMDETFDADIPELGRLASMLSNKVCLLRFKAARVVTNISKCWDGPKGLSENNFVPVMLKRLAVEESEWVKEEILLGLEGCLLHDQAEALSFHEMQILSELLQSKLSKIRAASAACISALLTHPVAKTVANELDLLKLLLPLLYSEDRAESAKAAGCVSFMTTTTPAKLRAIELEIIERLLFLAVDFHCLQSQLNCIKALTSIAEAPKGREILLRHGVEKISSIPSQNEEIVERSIRTLIEIIQWKP